jgi:hypothetical protein
VAEVDGLDEGLHQAPLRHLLLRHAPGDFPRVPVDARHYKQEQIKQQGGIGARGLEEEGNQKASEKLQ